MIDINTKKKNITKGGDFMEDEKFKMLMNILKILEKNDSTEVAESVLDVIDNFDESFSADQRSEILKEFLHFRKHKEVTLDYKQESYREGFEEFIRRRDFF